MPKVLWLTKSLIQFIFCQREEVLVDMLEALERLTLAVAQASCGYFLKMNGIQEDIH